MFALLNYWKYLFKNVKKKSDWGYKVTDNVTSSAQSLELQPLHKINSLWTNKIPSDSPLSLGAFGHLLLEDEFRTLTFSIKLNISDLILSILMCAMVSCLSPLSWQLLSWSAPPFLLISRTRTFYCPLSFYQTLKDRTKISSYLATLPTALLSWDVSLVSHWFVYGSVSSDLHQGLSGAESLEPGSGCLRLCGPHGLLPEVEGTRDSTSTRIHAMCS